MQKLLPFFQQKLIVYAIFNDQRCNNTLSNDIVSLDNWALFNRGLIHFIAPNKLLFQFKIIDSFLISHRKYVIEI